MLPLPLTMACGPYDRMEALWNGAVQPEGLALRYLAIGDGICEAVIAAFA